MIDPTTWLPSAAGTIPAPTAAAEPLDDPPGVAPASKGLVVGPGTMKANSVVTVLPRITAPASRRAFTDAESMPVCRSLKIGLPRVVGISLVWSTSLMPMGIPSIGESARPAL